MSELIISKLDAARRQLETAVRLYFNEGDPVSIHTLTSASYNVIHAVNKKQGGTPMIIKDFGLAFVKPEFVELLRKKLNEAENFFKHADRDADKTLQFNPLQTELLMLDACDKYRSLTGEIVPNFQVFISWFMFQNAELFNLSPEMETLYAKLRPNASMMSRPAFFVMALPIISKLQV